MGLRLLAAQVRPTPSPSPPPQGPGARGQGRGKADARRASSRRGSWAPRVHLRGSRLADRLVDTFPLELQEWAGNDPFWGTAASGAGNSRAWASKNSVLALLIRISLSEDAHLSQINIIFHARGGAGRPGCASRRRARAV